MEDEKLSLIEYISTHRCKYWLKVETIIQELG